MKKNRLYPLLCLSILCLAGCGGKTEAPPAAQSPGGQTAPAAERVGPRGILHRGVKTEIAEPAQISESEARKKATAERMDKGKLLGAAKVVVDQDGATLMAPDSIRPFLGRGLEVAKEAPRVEFGIVPVKPRFFADPPEGNHVGPWSNWSQAVFFSKTGKFYSSLGDHGAYDAHIYIVEFDPAAGAVRCLPEVNAVLGRTKDQFSEGKIHGWLDFFPRDSSTLWFCTYWAKYPEPEEKDFATGYDGGHIMSLDVLSGDIVDYGVPLKRASWPYHRVDTRRGIMYAVGMFGEFLAWDIKEQKTLWAGYLPEGMQWWNRAIMIDEETGLVYTSNQAKSDPDMHILKYDPASNRFSKLNCVMPAGPLLKPGVAPARSQMRAQTAGRGPDGLFWAVTLNGELFSFDPLKEAIVDRGENWPGDVRYTCSMARSPKGRYLYYLPGAHGRSAADGAAVVQYDILTGTKKALAFLHPFYFDKYGYTMGGTYSIALDDSGERLFVLMNGAFIDPEEQAKLATPDVFGQASVLLIHIPESERAE
jgi:hypothetical protein